jgi:hypothetical protein
MFRRRVIQRETSRVLVLNLSGKKPRCSKHRWEKFVLDTAFALIEGHPRDIGHPPRQIPLALPESRGYLIRLSAFGHVRVQFRILANDSKNYARV